MGGAALGRQAKILTTAHLECLIKHCQDALAPLFAQTLPLYAFAEKETHGDLDLLVAYEIPFDPKKVKGEEFGLLDDEGESIGPAPWHPVQGGLKDKAQGKEGDENDKFREWAIGVVRALHGREWRRSGVKGGIMSVGIPCVKVEGLDIESLGFYVKFEDDDSEGLTGEGAAKSGARQFEKEPFYQVDLQFIPPETVAFTHFFRSYSNILLSHMITLLSPHLRGSGSHVTFNYSPYPGLGPIKLDLTADPEDFCNWLGLDYGRFLRGFETKKDLWAWITEVKEGSKAEKVWKGLVRRYKERQATGIVVEERVRTDWKSRNPGWKYFLEWLRLSEDSPFRTTRESGDAGKQAALVPLPETPMMEKAAGIVDGPSACSCDTDKVSASFDAAAAAAQTTETAERASGNAAHSAPDNETTPAETTQTNVAAATVPLPETPATETRPALILPSPSLVTDSTDRVPPIAEDTPIDTATKDNRSSNTGTWKADPAPAMAKTAPKDKITTLDPARPLALCPTARDALQRWGMMEQFEAQMAIKREAAEVMLAAQRANVEERAREWAEKEAEAAEAAATGGPDQSASRGEGGPLPASHIKASTPRTVEDNAAVKPAEGGQETDHDSGDIGEKLEKVVLGGA